MRRSSGFEVVFEEGDLVPEEMDHASRQNTSERISGLGLERSWVERPRHEHEMVSEIRQEYF